MPTTDLQDPSPSSSSAFGFSSILSRRRDQVHHSMDPAHEPHTHETELEAFQRKVADRFHDLSAASAEDLLSIPWLRKLLESFLACQDDFNDIVLHNKPSFNKPPMDRHVSEFFDRSVKALDVCNAVRDGIEQIRQWQKQLEIVLCAFDSNRNIGEGQLRRAKRALADLALGMLDEKDSSSHSHTPLAHRNRSFGRNNNSNSNSNIQNKGLGHFRSLSWSVSRSWSASKQLQAISYNLVAPKANETTSTNGLNLAVFTMSYVLLFVMWALVAAIPCQDRGLQTHFLATKQFQWATPILSLHERILEESKRRDRRNACGLLREIQEIEKATRNLNEMTDSVVQFPLGEKEKEVKERVGEVGTVYGAVKQGLDPLEKRVRDVFRRIVRSRAEGLDSGR